MKKLLVLFVATIITASCGVFSKRSLNSTNDFENNSLKVQKTAVSSNAYKIIPKQDRIMYTINDKRRLKGLTLDQAKEKVLAEAIMKNNCALIVEPNYSYDLSGKRVIRITIAGYPANYDFNEIAK